jgi:hypothetical protein
MEEHRSRYFLAAGCALALLLFSAQPAFSATKPDGTLEIIDGKEQFMSTLASMPYTSSGTGPVLYLLECSACPYSQAFEKDWKGKFNGLEMRRILIAMNATTANETAYLARTRDINDFYAFMNHTKVAPAIEVCKCPDDNKAIEAVKSVVQPFGKVLKPIMIKNGWSKDSPAPPQFMWETNGHVYVGRYYKNSFPEILSMLRAGSQTTQPSAPPSRTSAHDSASTIKETSATESTGQLMSAEKITPEPVENATTTNSGSTSARNGGSGPDVVGFRIGMTPDEARAIFKSNILVSDELRKSYKEQRMIMPTLPSKKYLNSIRAGRDRDLQARHQLHASFSPVPGHEEIVSVWRGVTFPRDQKPVYNVVMKALVEKYGTPTNSYGTKVFSWVYDRNGALHSPDNKDPNSFCRTGFLNLGAEQSNTMWSYMFNEAYTTQRFNMTSEQVIATCGAVYIYVEIDYPYASITGDALVDGQNTTMVGYDAALRGAKEAKALTDKASEAANTAAIKKGQQQKPEF